MINKHSCTAATASPARRCVGLEARASREFRPLEQTTFYCTPHGERRGRWLLPGKRYRYAAQTIKHARGRWKPVASRRRVLRSILLVAAHSAKRRFCATYACNKWRFESIFRFFFCACSVSKKIIHRLITKLLGIYETTTAYDDDPRVAQITHKWRHTRTRGSIWSKNDYGMHNTREHYG